MNTWEKVCKLFDTTPQPPKLMHTPTQEELMVDDEDEKLMSDIIGDLEDSGKLEVDNKRINETVEACQMAKRKWRIQKEMAEDRKTDEKEHDEQKNRDVTQVCKEARNEWRKITGG